MPIESDKLIVQRLSKESFVLCRVRQTKSLLKKSVPSSFSSANGGVPMRR